MGHHGNTFLTFGAAPVGEIGGWIELGRTTLGSANATIDVTSLSDKRYLMVLCNSVGVSAGANTGTQLNGDTATNYARRGSNNGGADVTDVTFPDMEAGATSTEPYFQVGYLSNFATKEKLLISHLVAGVTAGADTAPFRNESVGKHAQTTTPISSYQWITSAASTFDTGSECVVLGWDPADTQTTNFWEPLADVDLSTGEADVIDTGTITAKKYLWFQYFIEKSGSIGTLIRFNSDSGNNYASRQSLDGGADDVEAGISHLDFPGVAPVGNNFGSAFVINESANEKLVTGHTVDANTAGAGNAPARSEQAAKWANIVSQITQVTITNSQSGNFGKDSFLKVWGSN